MNNDDPTPTDDTLAPDYTAEFATLDGVATDLATLEGASEFVRTAIDHGVQALDPVPIGDFGVLVRKRNDDHQIFDVREWEDEPRLAGFVELVQCFVSVDSLARYVARYSHPAETVAYLFDSYGRGTQLLTSDTTAATIVIDDHPITADTDGALSVPVGRRSHCAHLVLRPTEPARRWGEALKANRITQEQFLDLIVDGITEIAEPDGAVLRDLVSDLHAIRTSEVQSVVRTGGEGTIEVKENVKLHAGTGTVVSFPEQMTVTLAPFVGVTEQIVLTVRIKPQVASDRVEFSLSCGHLDAKLATVLGSVAATIADRTGLNPLWKP